MSDPFTNEKRSWSWKRQPSIFRDPGSGTAPVRRVLGGLVVCLAVTALLSSGRLVSMAERQEFGESRDRWLAAANGVDRTASAVGLDRPADAIDELLGRSASSSTVVLGDLAAQPSGSPSESDAGASTTTTTTTSPAQGNRSTTTLAAESTTTLSPTTTQPSTTLEPTTTTLSPLGVVTPDQPLQIWIGGDSLGEYVGSRLLYKVADPDLSDVELDFHISTGLARPDYFDWPARLSEVMSAEERPQVVVFMVGGNDDQDMVTDGTRFRFDSAEWAEEYRRRVTTMMDITAYEGTQMLWINLPPMRYDRRAGMAVVINQILAEEAERRPWVSVTDIVETFSNDEGGYEQYLAPPDGDSTVRARANDGVHITSSASEWVADMVWDSVHERWAFPAPPVPDATE